MDHPDLQKCRHVTVAAELTGHKDHVTGVAWSPDGRWLASCARDGQVHLWSPIRSAARPRFTLASQSSTRPGLTSIAWSLDGRYIACGTTAGWLDIWEVGVFKAVAHPDPGARSAITCVAWGGGTGNDVRLAFGEDRVVHFRNYARWDEPDIERGVGHDFAILSIAWAPDGSRVLTGTSGGTIGVWAPSTQDNELRDLLTVDGIHAHHGAVRRLAFSPENGVLASGAGDGLIRLWDVESARLVDELSLDEEVLDLAFAYGGRIIVVHARDHVRFLRCKPLLQEIESYYYPAALDPCPATIAVNEASELATIDPEHPTSIVVWRVDFASLFKLSNTTSRAYRAAAVSLLGESGSGRTNLALGLTGAPFVAEASAHDFRVHRLPVRVDDEELHEVALWDLPTRVDHALVHRIHAGYGAVALMVLAAIPGTRPTAAENIQKWHHTLRRWNTVSRDPRQSSLVVVTRADEFDRPPSAADAAALALALDVDRVIMTSARTDLGIAELRQVLIAAIDWSTATGFPSIEVLDQIRVFGQHQREQGQFLTSTRELHQAFLREYPFARKFVTSEDVFRRGIQLLEVLGSLELFERRDEILLDPAYYHTYASAMIAGAERDEKGMGRLPLIQAETLRGKQIRLGEAERLRDDKQEARLLHLTIAELVASGVAQIVSTDGVSYLVFPISTSVVRPPSDKRAPRSATCRFEGEADQTFSSLVVRLLGLENHYPKYELWKHEARFVTATGGCCEIALTMNDAGDEGDLAIGFEPNTVELERRQFTEMVRSHVAARGTIRSMDEPPRPEEAAPAAGAAGGPVEVFFCWRGSDADAATTANVNELAVQLHARGIRTTGVAALMPGDTIQDQLSVLERSRVALLLLSGPMSRRQEIDFRRLLAAGCRVIPVILPNARKSVTVPPELRQTVGVDFRGRFLVDIEPLATGIVEKWRLGAATGDKARGGVFLSYSRTDHEQVSELRRELEVAGHRVWWDGDEADLPPGSYWQDQIREAIHRSYAFIWCLSEISVMRSQSWMYPEVLEAIKVQQTLHPSRVFIIPVRLSECDVPDLRIDAVRNLNHLQRFDYFARRQNLGELVHVLDTARQQGRTDLMY
jgi:WD40 repeat protein